MRISDWSSDVCSSDLARVARTRDRPIASGRVSVKAAWVWLVALCLIGLVVLLQLTPLAQGIALGSLGLVAAYPFMKRITWWPQAWLGLVFTWGALVGWPAATDGFDWPALALYGAAFWWVMGYDTIYALQDVEDDAIAGVKSSARRLGGKARVGIVGFYALRSEEHTSELQSLMRISYAVFCLKKKNNTQTSIS